ncbi:MAG: electron transfer flavoprotein subunit alpha/FixB family protein [Acidobacteria bacterium]|nr:electron transfer flavoprotein subunit alpha/FixB family protein [Acidobacteriota bacterium]
MSLLLVVLEQGAQKWHKMSWEAVAAGQQIAQQAGMSMASVVIGQCVAAMAAEVPGKVFAIEHALLEHYTADGYTAALAELIKAEQPALVIFPHTYQVRDFAPKLATRFGQVLISDVTQVKAAPGTVTFVRQLFQGKLNADVSGQGGVTFMSVQAGSYRADQMVAGPPEVQVVTPVLDASAIRQKPEAPFRESTRAVDLTAADIIVSVGRGIKEKDNIHLVEELAAAMGAELAASRPICDNGWLPMERQVGSSGQTVSPKVYMAIGISGAIQHLVGMKGSKTIVAINKDPNAPIFEVADYGICGDLFEVVPALIDEVKKARG